MERRKNGKIAIIEDDNTFAIEFRNKLHGEYFTNEEIDILNFFDWDYIIKNKIDLLFVDIELPGGVNGIEEAEKIRKMKYWNIEIIFVSNRQDLIQNSFVAGPTAFVTKQNLDQELMLAMLQLKRKGFREKKYINVNETVIEINNIIYIESLRHDIVFNMCFDSNIRIRAKLEQIEKELEVSHCIRIHKSFIVNTCFIKKRYHDKVILLNDCTLPVGRTYAEKFKTIYTQLKIERII